MGSGIPRIIDKVKAAGLQEPEFIGGEVDLRINIYRGQVDTNSAMINANGIKNGANGVNCGRKTVADYREESVCNTGILCGRNGYIKKNGF